MPKIHLTMFAIMSMLSKWTQTEITAAWKFHTGATKIARIIFAYRHLTRCSEIAGGTFALPTVLKLVGRDVVCSIYVVLVILIFEKFLFASSAIPTRIRQTSQGAAFRNAKAVVSISVEKIKF